jgi:ankyrin repeat protein
VQREELRCCEILIRHGADPTTALAAALGKPAALRLLLDAKPERAALPGLLVIAAAKGDQECCRLLIEDGVPLDGPTLLERAAPHPELFDLLLEKGADANMGLGPLVRQPPQLVKLFAHGANPHGPQAAKALDSAILLGEMASVRALLESHVPVRGELLRKVSDWFRRGEVWSPLGTVKPSLELVETLLERGNAADAVAAAERQPGLWSRLIEGGAKANNEYGERSLHRALERRDEELAWLLLRNGARGWGVDLHEAWELSRDLFDKMLESGAAADDGLWYAVRARDLAQFKALLARGVDAQSPGTARGICEAVAVAGETSVFIDCLFVEGLLASERMDPTFTLPFAVGNVTLLRRLLSAGANACSTAGAQALKEAIRRGDAASKDVLVAHGASMKAATAGGILRVLQESVLTDGWDSVRELDFLVKECRLPLNNHANSEAEWVDWAIGWAHLHAPHPVITWLEGMRSRLK